MSFFCRSIISVRESCERKYEHLFFSCQKNFDINLCAKMMSSIPRRLEAVIKNQGRRILKDDY